MQAETDPNDNKKEEGVVSVGEVGLGKETGAAINIERLYRDAMRIVSSSRMALAKVCVTADTPIHTTTHSLACSHTPRHALDQIYRGDDNLIAAVNELEHACAVAWPNGHHPNQAQPSDGSWLKCYAQLADLYKQVGATSWSGINRLDFAEDRIPRPVTHDPRPSPH